ncbi:MAG TPA: exodeoxyribonuclease V subunit beta [Polyangiales bacterium]|nr:exodeoxyribonuclease V subunit beta [Polyangiales bacterium]
MSGAPALDLLQLPLEGTTLVEASAGTGKTHTISTLFVRLLLEKGLGVSEILVVTYTRAATAELRLRIRRRLMEALACFDQQPTAAEDPVLAGLRDRAREAGKLEDARKRLADALRQFDEAAIATIHGYCQRVLAGYSFESGAAFDLRLLEDDRLLVDEVVQDFWANRLCEASETFAAHLRSRLVTLNKLAQLVERALGNPDIALVPAPAPLTASRAQLEQDVARAAERAQQLWCASSAELIRLLSDGRLHGARYKPEVIRAQWAPELGAMAELPVADLPKYLSLLTPQALSKNAKKGKPAPVHEFFDACQELHEARCALLASLDAELIEFRHALLAYARVELPRRKAQAGQLGFDDLLLSLRAALRSARGEALTARLRQLHPAALIDEFQDTDPVQCEIFSRIYAPDRPEPGSLFLVGDPKQAIYAFRGADIFAYLQAAAGAPRASLPVNYRSDPRLLEALNAIWQRAARPFLWEQIDYQPVSAPAHAFDRLRGPLGERAPFEILFVPRTALDPAQDRPISKTQLEARLPELVACEIVDVLESGSRLAPDPTAEGRPIAPRDIAVLCRTNRQAQRVQLELRRLGVPAVLDGDASVFDSEVAAELLRVMSALAEPGSAGEVRAALATSLLGQNAADLERLEHDERAWDEWVRRFHELCELWQTRGFIRALHALLDRCGVAERLLTRDDGERRYTDLMHLVELLHAEASRSKAGPLALLEWLRRMIQGETERMTLAAADMQIRLESDAQAVTLTTIHKSKGLEYALVYCPFSWDGANLRGLDKEHPRFHAGEHGERLTLDLGAGEDAKPDAAHKARAEQETLAEELRLLYVALTRAKQRVSVVWGALGDAKASALGYVLHPARDPLAPDQRAATVDRLERLSDAELKHDLAELAAAAGGAIELREVAFREREPWHRPEPPAQGLAARVLLRSPADSLRSHSFSRLASETRVAAHAVEGPAIEGIDRDESARSPATDPLPGERPRVTLADFAAGASFGHLVHSIYEEIDFRAQSADELLDAVSGALAEYGMPELSAQGLARAVFESLRAPLTVGGLELPSLSVVPPEARIAELEFVFPIPEPAAPSRAAVQQELFAARGAGLSSFSAKRLAGLLAAEGKTDTERAYAERLRSLGFGPVSGYLRGFMDLVVQHDGRFYLIDYKSNHLGDHAEDYAQPKLMAAMFDHHYVLQALIYSLALHRYLARRQPGYDYARHFGGVYYLFVRGMSPEHLLGSGVFAERPSAGVIAAFDALLGAMA